jgi:hypothetical protein
MMQEDPRRFGERRTEHVELKDDRHFALCVEYQFTAPKHPGRSSAANAELLVPLGEFTKTRLPELTVTGPNGQRLPVASRAARGEIVATLFTGKWQDVIFHDLHPSARPTAEELWSLVQLGIVHVVTLSPDAAREARDALLLFLDEMTELLLPPLSVRIVRLIFNPEFLKGLDVLAEKRLLIASMRGVPGETYLVTLTYTEAMKTNKYGGNRFRRLLAWLGLTAIPISRQAANSGKAASYWTVASAPPGIEVLRLFWRSDRNLVPSSPSISVDARRAVIGRYEWSSDDPEDSEQVFDVQIAPSASVAGTFGLAAVLLYVSRYVYQGFPRPGTGLEVRTVLLSLGTLLVAIPATIAGALAYKDELFTRYASRGPRALVAGLSMLGALLAVGVTLKGISSFTEAVACILSIYCIVVLGVFGYIHIGFRWRNNDAARLLWLRKPLSPSHCRKRQTQVATAFFAALVLTTIAFAKCEFALQHKHFLTAFPREIVHALSHW